MPNEEAKLNEKGLFEIIEDKVRWVSSISSPRTDVGHTYMT